MDEKRPKRRKDKYNPYTLTEKEDKHFLSFQDGQGMLRELQITKELFEVLNRFELDDLSILNEWDRHYEHSELRANDTPVQSQSERAAFFVCEPSQAMRAADREPTGGEIPVELVSRQPFDDFP